MGTVLGQSINESKKIDIDLFLSKYSKNYKIENDLRNDIFKTLLVTSKEQSEFESGIPFVIKLFPIENENYLKYSQEFEEIKNQYSNLESNPNVIPIIKLDQMKEANVGIIIRQFIQYNLKQALYYLTCSSEIEKKWICFQLLQGLNQIHSKLKCHGDIKPENILVTSKFSVFFSDISVYKPVYLIIENLQLYNNFFYCNSVDRACYLAPERFVHNLEEVDKNNLNELTQEMDIFSLGVVFAEIFMDKQNIFTQNDLMNYKNKKIDLKDKLNGIKDNNIRNIIKNMINLEPKERIKLSELIRFFGNNLCPSPITRFIAHLNLMIIVYGYYKNDLLVALLYKHFIQIWKCLCINNKILEKMKIPILKKKLNKYLILQLLSNKYDIYKIKSEFPLAFIPDDNNNGKEIFNETEINEDFFINNNYNMEDYNNNSNDMCENDCTILIIKYLISCLENIKYISTYFSIFEMIYNLSKILLNNKNPNIIIDLVIPNYLNLFSLNNSKLNIETYNSIIDILNLINYDELILNKIDYNSFNYYIFENIYQLFLKSDKLELKFAIISRLDEIIELENNFLMAYLNTNNNIIINEKNKDKKNSLKNQYYQDVLFKTYLSKRSPKENEEEKNNKQNNIDFNFVLNNYIDDYNNFRKKLKDLVKKIMEEDNKNDSLKLLIIQKYKDICLFCGNYNDNKSLFNHLFILFNRNNYYIQKEIIKIFPSLILLFGNKLFYDYFLFFIESSCQKKNSELIIIEIIDVLIWLLKMDLINHREEYSKSYKILMCYKMLLPYIIHPNYLLRTKLNYLINQIISDEQSFSDLYISFYKTVKNILSESNRAITVISIINKDLINKINIYYSIPRELFLIYKYYIDCTYFNINYIDHENLLSEITKIKKDHFVNKIKKDINLKNCLGLIEKKDIMNIKKKSFLKRVNEEYIKMTKKKGLYKKEDSTFVQQNFKNKITILLNEMNKNKEKKGFLNKWYEICSKGNINYSKIIFLLKVLNCKLDIKDIITNNLIMISGEISNKEIEYKDWNVLDDIESSNFKSINPMNYIIKDHKNIKFCYELNLNQSESIIKLIPVNCFITEFYQNFFVSITDEGVIRLHNIYNDTNFEKIYIIKNRAQYKIELKDFILKANHISYVEKKNKIMIIVAIQYKIEIITFELNNEKYDLDSDNLIDSCVYNSMECKSMKEIISIENMGKTGNNFVVLGNIDNSISFYNYIDNNIDYINNCSSFPSNFGNIELIISFIYSDNILLSTSNGFLILYDYNLRFFTNVYSFSKRRRIKQIIEYIPGNIIENIVDFQKQEIKSSNNNYIFILTNDDQITLWNLSLSQPIIIYELIKVNKIEDYKKAKSSHIEIPKMQIIPLEKENFSFWSADNFISESQFIKINNNLIFDMKSSSVEIITGEKQGICRALNFSNENLKKIKNKQGHKNNKFSQIIFNDGKDMNLETRNNSKYIKEEGVFINKLIYSINNRNENKIGINNYEKKEMVDLIVLRDYFSDSNVEFIIAGYSNGNIKLWTI